VNFPDTKTEFVAEIISSRFQNIKNLLVVGCGSGFEAAILGRELRVNVVGIDLEDSFDAGATQFADLKVGDATALEFDDNSFDFIYSYHALEHIHDPRKALREMKRVLKPGGGFWVGTPNRSRWVGYVGSQNTSAKKKLMWNLTDWKYRLKGQFKNEYGAHAGFTPSELRELLRGTIGEPEEATSLYYLAIYQKYRALVQPIANLGLGKILFPSIYFIGTKP